jgi:hypothetical protein
LFLRFFDIVRFCFVYFLLDTLSTTHMAPYARALFSCDVGFSFYITTLGVISFVRFCFCVLLVRLYFVNVFSF